jgi:hypothetical protein
MWLSPGKQVVVFCSFDPSELRVEDTASRGIKDLRDYLVLAKEWSRSIFKNKYTAPHRRPAS